MLRLALRGPEVNFVPPSVRMLGPAVTLMVLRRVLRWAVVLKGNTRVPKETDGNPGVSRILLRRKKERERNIYIL